MALRTWKFRDFRDICMGYFTIHYQLNGQKVGYSGYVFDELINQAKRSTDLQPTQVLWNNMPY